MSLIFRAPPPPGMDAVPTGTVASLLSMSTSSTFSLPSSSPTASSSSSSSSSSPDGGDGECHLLGSFSILVQGVLGLLALSSLVYKRWRERPQRPVKIWAFDVSKQVVGSIMLHLLNLAMSELSSGAFSVVAAATNGAQGAAQVAASAGGSGGVGDQPGAEGAAVPTGEQREGMGMLVVRGLATIAASVLAREEGEGGGGNAATKMPAGAQNPCSFYLLNLAIDTTVGIPILITLLKLATYAAARTPLARPPESIQSGNYGRPPRATWWLKQCLVYFVGLLGMKLCVFFIFQLCPWLGAVGDWALRWTEGNQQLQIFFVMFFFPLVMNALQYYIIDGFIKEQTPGGKDGGSGGTAADSGSYQEIRQQDEDDDEEDGRGYGENEALVSNERRAEGGMAGQGRREVNGNKNNSKDSVGRVGEGDDVDTDVDEEMSKSTVRLREETSGK